jgi:IS30 family transposase
MSERNRKKWSHLTWEERRMIQAGLRQHLTFSEMAMQIGCSADTISKEIRKHRYHKSSPSSSVRPNYCKFRDSCRRRDVCHKRKGHKCRIPCRKCTSCNRLCPDFVEYPCQKTLHAPYVCNGCGKSTCQFDKYVYSADHANREYLEELCESRKGIDMTKEELIELDELVSPLIRKGQPLSHILSSHADEISVCERTLYDYISKGYMSIKNIDMRRVVRYRKRRHSTEAKVSPGKKAGHRYPSFLKEMENDPDCRIVEMDTVEGAKGGNVLMTLMWRDINLMLAFLLESKEMKNTAGVMDMLEEKLGIEDFNRLFPLILTDNGSEFADPQLFEYDADGCQRTRLYYCEPRHSEQKGGLEKNHEYIRYVLPKGTSFDELTQEKIQRLMDNINSTARPGLNGQRPIDLAMRYFGKDTVERLGLTAIDSDDVNLTPYLLK